MFYRNRKRLKDVRITLDLTRRRYGGTLKYVNAINLAKEHPDLDHVFAYVNCFKVVFKDGTSNLFIDIDNLKSMINNRSQVMRQGFFNVHC